MSFFSECVNSYPRISIAGIATILFAAVYFVWPQGDQPAITHVAMTYYYDQNTKVLFAVREDTVGLVETDSGAHKNAPAGVRAQVFTCDDGKTETQFIGWLEVSAAALKAAGSTASFPSSNAKTSSTISNLEVEPNDTLVRRPDSPRWVKLNSKAGERVLDIDALCPEGSRLRHSIAPTQPEK
jgi:hypothetical protein